MNIGKMHLQEVVTVVKGAALTVITKLAGPFDFGGHSIVNVLLLMALGSQSPSNAQAWTILPPFCWMGVSGRNGPVGFTPVSSSNSR